MENYKEFLMWLLFGATFVVVVYSIVSLYRETEEMKKYLSDTEKNIEDEVKKY